MDLFAFHNLGTTGHLDYADWDGMSDVLLAGNGTYFVDLEALHAYELQNYIIDCYGFYANSAIAINTFIRSIAGAVFPLFATDM